MPDPKYSIDELYESNVNIVAVLLINSSDALTLDPPLGHYNVLVPVYVISCVQGDEIIHHIQNAGGHDCWCKFTFLSASSEGKGQSHGNFDFQLTLIFKIHL